MFNFTTFRRGGIRFVKVGRLFLSFGISRSI